MWSPPLREKWNQDVLWNALKTGQLQTLGSDQCSFDFNGQKDLGKGDFSKIPNGGPIIEDRVSILFSEGVNKGQNFTQSVCRSYINKSGQIVWTYIPRKGTIAVGADADIVIFDPTVERIISAETHHMAVDYNAFEGMKVTGEPVSVLSRGEFVIQDKKFVGQLGAGKYLKRKKYGANDHSETTYLV